MSEPRVGVLALQGDVAEHRRVMSRLGYCSVPVRRPRELEDLAGIILPGGESTTMDRLLRSFGLFEPLREAIRGGLPAFGSCAGMILLADRIRGGRPDQQTLGGLDIVVRRNAFGRQVDSFEADLDVVGFETSMPAVFIRAPVVEEIGTGVQVLARVAHGEAAGRIVAVRAGHLLATSFHPEVTGDTRIHALFAAMISAAQGDHAPETKDDTA